MSRYRKTMRQAIEEGLSNMQVAILKKEYEPFRGKTISAARAKQLMNILDKFKDQDLQKLAKANIPFVSSGSDTKLRVRKMGFKVTTFNPMGSFKEEITQEDFDLVEGKMKTIATMFSQGKSAEEIAKAMKLPVDTVKNILGEVKEELEESAAASEIQKNNTRRDSMDYNMYKKTVELLKKKDFKALGKHIYDAETAPREYVMGVIAKKEPQTFKKMFGNQTGYYSLMKPLKMSESADTRELTNLYNKRTPLTPAEQKRKAELEKKLGVNEELEEKIQPFMISYSKYGKHAGFEDAKSLQDLQTKAQKLRAKGFTIDKMGRYNPPVRKEDKDAFDPITEACWTGYKQVGMKDKGGKKVPNCVPEEFKVEDYIVEDIEDKKKMKKADVAPDGDAEHAEKKEKQS